MIFSHEGKNQNRRGGLLFSAGAHAAVCALLLLALRSNSVRPVFRESRCCAATLYWTGNTGTSHARPHPAHRPRRHTRPSLIPAAPAATAPAPAPAPSPQPQTAAVPSPQQQPTLGTGSGTDNAEPALPVYFPTPGVADRSLLPPAEQNIVVHVSISALGQVTGATLVHGLGNGLDQVVLDTVKVWRFHPATLNGTAIASTEDLVFPFSQHTPQAAG